MGLPGPCWMWPPLEGNTLSDAGQVQRVTPCSQHWLQGFKSEHTDVSVCPSLPRAASLPRYRGHTLAFPTPVSLWQGQTQCQDQVRLGGSSAVTHPSTHPSMGVSSQTATSAFFNQTELKPPKPGLILLAEIVPCYY